METDDILADEVIQLHAFIVPHIKLASVLKAGDIAYGSIHPNIEILVLAAGNFETEIRCVARNAPPAQRLLEPLQELVGDIARRMLRNPLFKIFVLRLKLVVEMLGILYNWRFAASRTHRRAQFFRAVSSSALVAAISILPGSSTLRTRSLYETIGKEHLAMFAIKLRRSLARYVPLRLCRLVDLFAQLPILWRIGRVVVVELDLEIGKVLQMFGMAAGNKLFRRNAFLARSDHYRSAMRIISANINAFVAAHLLKTHPKIGLDILNQVSDVNVSIGIRQRARNHNSSFFSHAEYYSKFRQMERRVFP